MPLPYRLRAARGLAHSRADLLHGAPDHRRRHHGGLPVEADQTRWAGRAYYFRQSPKELVVAACHGRTLA